MKLKKLFKSVIKTGAAVSCGYATLLALQKMKTFDPVIMSAILGVAASSALLFFQASEDLAGAFE